MVFAEPHLDNLLENKTLKPFITLQSLQSHHDKSAARDVANTTPYSPRTGTVSRLKKQDSSRLLRRVTFTNFIAVPLVIIASSILKLIYKLFGGSANA
jgi:hypothetical protein